MSLNFVNHSWLFTVLINILNFVIFHWFLLQLLDFGFVFEKRCFKIFSATRNNINFPSIQIKVNLLVSLRSVFFRVLILNCYYEVYLIRPFIALRFIELFLFQRSVFVLPYIWSFEQIFITIQYLFQAHRHTQKLKQ